jgi:hypothetical protein
MKANGQSSLSAIQWLAKAILAISAVCINISIKINGNQLGGCQPAGHAANGRLAKSRLQYCGCDYGNGVSVAAGLVSAWPADY